MDHQRASRRVRELDLRAERGFLRVERRVVVVQVEAGLADADDARGLRQLDERRPLGLEPGRVVGMEPDRGVDVVVALRPGRPPPATSRDPSRRRPSTPRRRPGPGRGSGLPPPASGRQVAVAVDPHLRPSPPFATGQWNHRVVARVTGGRCGGRASRPSRARCPPSRRSPRPRRRAAADPRARRPVRAGARARPPRSGSPATRAARRSAAPRGSRRAPRQSSPRHPPCATPTAGDPRCTRSRP